MKIITVTNERISLWLVRSVWSLGSGAFDREALRKTLDICAVIVDHVVVLHPFQPFLTCTVQLLWKPIAITWSARRCSRGPNTSFSVKISVRGSERSYTPICLDKSTSGCPIISIPEARVYSHRLALQEWNTVGLLILELSNGSAINWKTETRTVQ